MAGLAFAQTPTITEYPVGTNAFGIALGSDGALWYTEITAIGRIDSGGGIKNYPVPEAFGGLNSITAGPDGALWFTQNPGIIGRITTAGVLTQFPLPSSSAAPYGITAGSDGALWFGEFGVDRNDKIGRITTAGVITEFTIPTTYAGPYGITPGPDGALWFTEIDANQIGRITTDGNVSQYPLPVPNTAPLNITTGPDGALWFTGEGGIGRITTGGAITLYPFVGGGSPGDICLGPDGALWFTLGTTGMIGRITTAGTVSEYPVPTAGAYPFDIVAGPNGTLWFTESGTTSGFGSSGAVGRIGPAGTGPVISSAALPTGAIGIPYSVALTADGGTAPYGTWALSAGSLPPGLTLNPSLGVIGGTPTTLGTFSFDVTVADATGAASPPQPFSIAVCSYSISPAAQDFTAAGGSGTIAITTGGGCPWTVTAPPAWVTLTSPSSGTGSGTVSYLVSPNSGTDQNGSFTVAQQSFTVAEEGSAIPNLTLIGSMPHLAAEGGWSTTFTLVNKSATPVLARTSLLAPDGTPLVVPVVLPQQTPLAEPVLASSLDQTIAANATFLIEATGPPTTPYVEGSAQIAATGAVDGFEIFHFDPTQQEAVVPLETRNTPSYVLAFDNTNNVATGVAIGNSSSAPASVSVIIRNDSGTQIGTETIALNGGGHTSFVMSTQYPSTANIRGTIEFDTPGYGTATPGQISVLGIRYTPPGTLTTIPSLANVGTNGGAFAHVAAGSGWETTFVLVNTGASAASATLNFLDENGLALPLPLAFPQTNTALASRASSYSAAIAAGASLWIQSEGLASELLTGSAQLATTGNVSGFVIFRYDPNGQEAVVPLETRNAGSYLIPFDNTGGIATGIAISAISSQAVLVPIILRDDTGAPIGTGSIPLAANGHTSFILATQFPAIAGIRGTIEFDTPVGTTISVLGIRSPPALTFTTLPALAK